MCQLNLYMVPKKIPTQKVMDIFQKNHLEVIVSEYYKLDEFVDSYEFYCTSYHCDCNSIISRLQEEDLSSFEEYKEKRKEEDLEKLKRMKILKASKDYDIRARELEEKSNTLLELSNEHTKYIDDYEAEERERIDSLGLQEEERTKMFNEVFLPKLSELYNELENNKEYQKAMEEYYEFLTENDEMFQSIYFNIEEFQKRIDEYDYNDFIEEFYSFKNICTEVLELADEICIYPFWQNEEPLDLKKIRQVEVQNLCIEDLTFLPYKNLLKIKVHK